MSARSDRIVAMAIEYGRCFSEALMHQAASKADLSESEAHKWIRRLRLEIDALDAEAESVTSRPVTKVSMSVDPALLQRAMKAEVEAGMLRAKVDMTMKDWEDECNRTDSLLTILGLPAERCRSEGGSLLPHKVLTLLGEARAEMVKRQPLPLLDFAWPDRDVEGYKPETVRRLLAAEREHAALEFAQFLHSLPAEQGWDVGPARVKFNAHGALEEGPLWATQEDTLRWARAFLGA